MEDELLIVDDLMLLLLSNDGKHIAGSGTLNYLLAAAVLVELAQGDRIEISSHSMLKGTMIRASTTDKDAPALADPLLDRILETMGKQEQTTYTWLVSLGADLRVSVLDRLIGRGIIDENTKKILGFIPSTQWPEKDSGPESRLRSRIGEVVEKDGPTDPRTGAILSLLSAGQVYALVRPTLPWSMTIAKRLRKIEIGEEGISGVSESARELMVEIAKALSGMTSGMNSATVI